MRRGSCVMPTFNIVAKMKMGKASWLIAIIKSNIASPAQSALDGHGRFQTAGGTSNIGLGTELADSKGHRGDPGARSRWHNTWHRNFGNEARRRRISAAWLQEVRMADAEAEKAGSTNGGPETNQPGLRAVRNAVHNRVWSRFPKKKALRRDAIAGLSSAISNVPDGMANGALLGVSPVHGLYGAMAGPAVGGALSSTQLMMITTMAAASLSAAQA